MTVALVTGAGRGLGRAVAEGLAREGHHVLVTARRIDAAQAVADGISSEGLTATSLRLDVTSPDDVASVAAYVRDQFGALDVLVNSAGVLPEATAGTGHDFADPGTFRTTFETNLFGPLALTEALLGSLRAATAARIVNVSTQMGSLADQTDPESPFHDLVVPAYQTSKAALNGLTIALSKHLAGTGIVVTSVCPGFVRTELTPMNRDAPLTPDQAAKVIVGAASATAGSASGTFVNAEGPLPW